MDWLWASAANHVPLETETVGSGGRGTKRAGPVGLIRSGCWDTVAQDPAARLPPAGLALALKLTRLFPAHYTHPTY